MGKPREYCVYVVVIDKLSGKPLLISSSEAIVKEGKGEGWREGGERERDMKEASGGSSVKIFKLGAHQLYHESIGNILRLDTVFTN